MRRASASGSRSSERGGALLPVVLLLLFAAGLAAACLAPTPALVRSASERVARARARYLAMGAAARARRQIELGALAVVGEVTDLLSPLLGAVLDATPLDILHAVSAAPDESAQASVTRQSDGSYLIVAYGKAAGVVAGVREVVR
ncbi:MAG TPA: hypothetical protein VHF22_02450, partial [Planctomycetota bacterium]|nr:hypothetical protein [Planctomycetota bacterium]